MQEDKSRDYMNSRRVTREYEVVTKGLNRNNPSVPPQNTAEEAKQVIHTGQVPIDHEKPGKVIETRN